MSRDRDDYWGDVVYEVWRSGGDVDRIDDDRVEDSRWDGIEYEQAARVELQHQRPPEPSYEPEYEPFDANQLQDDHDDNR